MITETHRLPSFLKAPLPKTILTLASPVQLWTVPIPEPTGVQVLVLMLPLEAMCTLLGMCVINERPFLARLGARISVKFLFSRTSLANPTIPVGLMLLTLPG